VTWKPAAAPAPPSPSDWARLPGSTAAQPRKNSSTTHRQRTSVDGRKVLADRFGGDRVRDRVARWRGTIGDAGADQQLGLGPSTNGRNAGVPAASISARPRPASAVLPPASYRRLQKIKAAYDPDQAIVSAHPVQPTRR